MRKMIWNYEIAYLEEKYFKGDQSEVIGESYMICKVLRKIPKGKTVKLDETFDDLKKSSMNRQQCRNMSKDMDNPDILTDNIKDSALAVVPIVVYR